MYSNIFFINKSLRRRGVDIKSGILESESIGKFARRGGRRTIGRFADIKILRAFGGASHYSRSDSMTARSMENRGRGGKGREGEGRGGGPIN